MFCEKSFSCTSSQVFTADYLAFPYFCEALLGN